MADELIGKSIGGKYEILTHIGEGGMAAVYLARQQSMNRQVAIKMLPKQFLNDDTYLHRFEREVTIVAQLDHRNIVPVYDYGEFEGQPYIVMRYMPAGSVDDLLRGGPMGMDRILSIMEQIAPALDYAHSKDVLHRDLKPSNVLMDDSGGAFLTDFGIARVLGEQGSAITTQGVVGTPSYMSPEQAQGKLLDGRSDVYSLGVMLFEMTTGKRPFESETPYSVAVMQVTTQPPMPRSINPAISSAVERVILKALHKDRDKRHPTASELAASLKLAIENPTATHDTEPNLKKPPILEQAPAPQPMPQPQPRSAPAAPYRTPTSAASRPVVQPPRSFRSRLNRRRKQSPLLSALLGGGLGCGLLAILIMIGVLAVSFLAPDLFSGGSIPDSTQASAFVTENPTDAPAAEIGATHTPDLDATSETARQTLVARNEDNEATFTPSAAETDSAATRTPGIDPVGIRGTPELLPVLRPVSGTIVFADIRPASVNGEEFRSLEIVSLNLDTWTETQLTQEPTANNSYPVASPDGRWIAYQSDRDGDFDIFIMNRLGGQQRRLTSNTYTDRLAGWSPDGEWIVYSTDPTGDELYSLRRVRVDGSEDQEILNNGQRMSHPRYSPDGRYLVFTMGAEPRDARTWEIARLDLETNEVITLTNNGVRDASPVFSPDGQSILYITYDSGSNAIAQMNADGSNPRILYDTSASDWSAAYSPDGAYIVFTSNLSGEDQLYLMTADGGSVQQITSGGGLFASWIPGL